MSLRRIENFEVLLAPVGVLAFAGLLALMYGWVGTMNSVGAERREAPEAAETRIVANTTPVAPPNMDGVAIGTGIGNTQMQLMDVNGRPIPGNAVANTTPTPAPQFDGMGIGTGIGNTQMQLLDVNGQPIPGTVAANTAPATPPTPGPQFDGMGVGTGIGNTQMQLLDVNGRPIPNGIGNGQMMTDVNGRPIQSGVGGLQGQIQLNNLMTPMGIGNNQMQLTNTVPIPSGIGGNQGNIQLVNLPGNSYLGLEVGNISGAMALQMGLPKNTGVFVKDVIPNTPASKAGFAPGDIIIKCDRQNVGSIGQMAKIISMVPPGQVIKFVIINHDGKKQSLHAKLSDGPTGIRQAAAVKAVGKTWLGIDIQNIDLVMKRQLNLPDRDGVIVSYLEPGSPAGHGGVKVGDVIRRVNGIHITDAGQFSKIFSQEAGTTPLDVEVLRQGHTISLAVRPQRQPARANRPANVPQAEMLVEGSWIGMDVSELLPDDTAEYGLPEGTRGIVVNDVESPPATTVGFQTGDCITSVNSTPTPTMKQFVKATKGQSGAVVDVIRGNRHMFITVPPPGFTQQGTPLDTGQPNPLNQVAMVRQAPQTIAVLAMFQSPNALVAGEQTQNAVVIFDMQKNSYATAIVRSPEQLAELLLHNGVTALIVSQITPRTEQHLRAHGVTVYTGVVGPAVGTVKLYQSGSLIAKG